MTAAAKLEGYFPSRQELTTYLASHPLFSKRREDLSKIIDAVAKLFARNTLHDVPFEQAVDLLLKGFNLGLGDVDFRILQLAIITALKDCAAGKIY